jgi:hypothetical protein
VASKESVFLSYGDLESIRSDEKGDDVLPMLREAARAATPEIYFSRFNKRSGEPLDELSRTPEKQFFAMLSLDADAQGFRNGSKAWRNHVREKCDVIFGGKSSPKIGQALTKFLNSIATG